jgi:ribosome-binding protein aMBF1 (putative translation factor)
MVKLRRMRRPKRRRIRQPTDGLIACPAPRDRPRQHALRSARTKLIAPSRGRRDADHKSGAPRFQTATDDPSVDVADSPWTYLRHVVRIPPMKASESGPRRPTDVKVMFGQRVRRCRKHAGLSQEALADLAGLDRTYVSGIERGKRNVSLQNICRLAAALKVEPAHLMKGLHWSKGAGDAV